MFYYSSIQKNVHYFYRERTSCRKELPLHSCNQRDTNGMLDYYIIPVYNSALKQEHISALILVYTCTFMVVYTKIYYSGPCNTLLQIVKVSAASNTTQKLASDHVG